MHARKLAHEAMANPSNVAQEGVVGVDAPPEPSRGREGDRAQGKNRGKSKTPSVDALEPRVGTLEIALSSTQDSFERLEKRVDDLEGEYGEFTVATKALMHEQANTLRSEFRSFHNELLKLRSFVQEELLITHSVGCYFFCGQICSLSFQEHELYICYLGSPYI